MDNLAEIIASAKRAAPGIPAEAWKAIEAAIRDDFGAQRIYIAARRRRKDMENLIAEYEGNSKNIADSLGLSVRRVQQLKHLL